MNGLWVAAPAVSAVVLGVCSTIRYRAFLRFSEAALERHGKAALPAVRVAVEPLLPPWRRTADARAPEPVVAALPPRDADGVRLEGVP